MVKSERVRVKVDILQSLKEIDCDLDEALRKLLGQQAELLGHLDDDKLEIDKLVGQNVDLLGQLERLKQHKCDSSGQSGTKCQFDILQIQDALREVLNEFKR